MAARVAGWRRGDGSDAQSYQLLQHVTRWVAVIGWLALVGCSLAISGM